MSRASLENVSDLSTKAHWDEIHAAERKLLPAPGRGGFKQAVKNHLGPGILGRVSAYSDYVLWNVIFPRHLHPATGGKVLEIGSAPGEFLVRFSRAYGCVPYGVEYSEIGAELNRAVFRRNGIGP